MLQIDIGYPVSHFNQFPVSIHDRYTLSNIIGSMLGMNGGVIFDDVKFSAKRYLKHNTDGHLVGKISLHIEQQTSDGKWNTVYYSLDEDLSTLEIIIYQIMQKIDRFPERDSRYNVNILDVEI